MTIFAARTLAGFLIAAAGISMPIAARPLAADRAEVNGFPVAVVELEASRGGSILPSPAALLLPTTGRIALELAISEFVSNGAVFECGGQGEMNRLQLSETLVGDGSSGRGRLRLLIRDRQGISHRAETSVLSPSGARRITISYQRGRVDFAVEGNDPIALPCDLELSSADRLVLVEPIGTHWLKFQCFTRPLKLDDPAVLDAWRMTAATTFLCEHREGQATLGYVKPVTGDLDGFIRLIQTPVSHRSLIVDASALDPNGEGTSVKPFRSISAAALVAGPGDTVLVRPGVYRESVKLLRSGIRDEPIQFQAVGSATVCIDGTDVAEGFVFDRHTAAADIWVKRGYRSRDVPFGDPQLIQILTARGPSGVAQLERRGRKDTVWLDGQLLPKADAEPELQPWSFWVSKQTGELLLALKPGDTPRAHLVEIGARDTLFSGDVSYIGIRGFRLSRADSGPQEGAIAPGLTSSNWVVEANLETGGNFLGFSIHGFDHLFRHNLAEANGNEGISGTLCEYLRLEGNTSRLNNWQRAINPYWQGGGGKFTQSHHLIIDGQESSFNNGPGIWFDLGNADVVVQNCRVSHNESGIFAEISPGPFLFKNNLCFANSGPGIRVGESSRVSILNNTLVNNYYGIELRNIPGRGGLGVRGEQWKIEDVAIRHNILAQNLMAGILSSHSFVDPAKDRVSSDYNLFYQNGAFASWQTDHAVHEKIDASNDWTAGQGEAGAKLTTLEAMKKSLGFEVHSKAGNPGFALPEANDYGYAVDASARWTGLQAGHLFQPGPLESK